MAITYHDDGSISMDVSFGQNVYSLSRTDFDIERVTGNILYGMKYWLTGSGQSYKLWFLPEIDVEGSFEVDFTGRVYDNMGEPLSVESTLDLDSDEVGVQPTVVIEYNTKVPRILEKIIPFQYTRGIKYDVLVAFTVKTKGWNFTGMETSVDMDHTDNNTFEEVFERPIANLGKHIVYKWTGTSPPQILSVSAPNDLSDTDWEVLGANEIGQYFLIRYPEVSNSAEGTFRLTLKNRGVRNAEFS